MERELKDEECDTSGGNRAKKKRLWQGLGLSIGVITVLVGLCCVIFQVPQRMVDEKIRSVLTLAPDSEIYQDWSDPPVPIFMKFYLFNVTNPEEIVSGRKPRLQERGPYTFRMNAPKKNVTFYLNNTVSYVNHYTLHFEPSLSIGDVNESFVVMNVPLASMASMMGVYASLPGAFEFMGELIKQSGGDNLFSVRTPNEILFGYRDPIFAMLNSMGLSNRLDFGFFAEFNNSNDGEYLVTTGDDAFQISKWNGNSTLNFWSSTYANMINGTDGSFFGSDLQQDSTPYVYISQMCRSMKLEYDRDATVKGVRTFRFKTATDLLANISINPDNQGFCVPPGNCYDSGVLSTSPCAEGAPSFVSLPHFYNAADKYQNSIIGLSPNREIHESYYYAEPKTGAVLKSHRRLQINIHLQPSDIAEQLKLVQDTIFPILWLDGSAEVDDDTAGNIETALHISNNVWVSSYLILSIGLLLVMVSLYHCLYGRSCVELDNLIDGKRCKKSTRGVVPKSSEKSNESESSLL